MVFTKNKTRVSNLGITIDNQAIGEVRETKFLGVSIDNELNWKNHIAYICGKISRGIGMIIKARSYLNQSGLMSLYHSFIYPYLTYCNQIWGSTYKTNLHRLTVLQNKAVRIICHAKPRESADPLYNRLGIMKLLDLNSYLIGRFMYRCHIEVVPEQFALYFTKNSDLHDHVTRTAHHFHAPQVKSDLSKTGIRYRGAIIWNAILSNDTNTDVSEAVFKKFLKRLIMIGILPQ